MVNLFSRSCKEILDDSLDCVLIILSPGANVKFTCLSSELNKFIAYSLSARFIFSKHLSLFKPNLNKTFVSVEINP